MVLLNDKAEKDIQQHNSEMKEMIRLIDQDKKLRDFMNAKSKERNEDKQLVEWRTRKGSYRKIF
jgi:coiled-coil domain-containing protein 63/114